MNGIGTHEPVASLLHQSDCSRHPKSPSGSSDISTAHVPVIFMGTSALRIAALSATATGIDLVCCFLQGDILTLCQGIKFNAA